MKKKIYLISFLLLFIPFLLLFSSVNFKSSESSKIYLIIHPLTDVTKFKRLWIAAQIFNPNNPDNTIDETLDMINPFSNNLSPIVISPVFPNPFFIFFQAYTRNLYTIIISPPSDLSSERIVRFIIYAYTWEDGDNMPTYIARGSVLSKFEENKWSAYNIYLTETGIQDGDWDTYSRCEIMKTEQDCNDNNPNMHPYNYERVDDDIDNDCDGRIDEATWVPLDGDHPH